MRHFLSALLVLSLPNSALSGQCTVNVTPTAEAEVVLSTRDIDKFTRGNIIDAPISTYRIGGDLYWFLPTAMQRNSMVYLSHSVLKGPDLSEAALVGIYNQSKLFVDSPKAIAPTKGFKWITNTYQSEFGVLAFVHVEYAGEHDFWGMPCMITVGGRKCAPGQSKIGLAWMEIPPDFSGVPRFTFLGHIAGFTADQPHFNVAGTPYDITKEGDREYLNIWFSDRNPAEEGQHVAWARSPLKEVIAAARAGRTTSWMKYNNGAWEDALTGRSSSALPAMPELSNVDTGIATGRVTVHSDVVKHVETGRYFLSAYTSKNDRDPSRFVFYDSCDGVRWKYNSFTNGKDAGSAKNGWSYMTFMDDDGTDNGRAAGSFTLLSGYDYGGPERHVAKFAVSVSAGCSCMATN